MLGGLSPRIGGIRLGSPMVGGDQYRRREAELANVRARRQALELEAARRVSHSLYPGARITRELMMSDRSR